MSPGSANTAWNPVVLASRIDQCFRQGSARAAHGQILDFNRRAEDSHVVHDKPFAMDRDTISLPATSNLRMMACRAFRQRLLAGTTYYFC